MTEKAKRVMLSRAVATVLAVSLVPSVAAAQLADTITPPAVVQEAEVQQTEKTLEAAALAAEGSLHLPHPSSAGRSAMTPGMGCLSRAATPLSASAR